MELSYKIEYSKVMACIYSWRIDTNQYMLLFQSYLNTKIKMIYSYKIHQ